MLRAGLALACLQLLSSAAASAEPLNGCFSRTYDAAHLAAHPGQTVSAMKLKLKPRQMDDGYNFGAELRFGFREDKRAFFAVGICKDTAGTLTCSLDQDAGQLTVQPAEGGVSLSPISDVRADSESGDESEYVTVKAANAEDRDFRLRSVAASECREFDTDE